MNDQQNFPLPPILWAVFGFGLRYFSYNFLVFAVLPTFFAVVVILLPVLPFLESIAFLLPDDITVEINWDETDIMRIYGMLTMITFILSELIRAIIRKVQQARGVQLQERQYIPLLRLLFIKSLIISVIFVTAMVVFPLMDTAEDVSMASFFWIFAIFYAVAMVSNLIFTILDRLAGDCLFRMRVGLQRKRQ